MKWWLAPVPETRSPERATVRGLERRRNEPARSGYRMIQFDK